MKFRATCNHFGAPIVIGAAGLACSRCDGPIVGDRNVSLYSQRDGERRPGWSRTKHLRVWARARKARHPGALAEGRARLLTEEACVAFGGGAPASRSETAAIVKLLQSTEDAVLTELGLSSSRRSA